MNRNEINRMRYLSGINNKNVNLNDRRKRNNILRERLQRRKQPRLNEARFISRDEMLYGDRAITVNSMVRTEKGESVKLKDIDIYASSYSDINEENMFIHAFYHSEFGPVSEFDRIFKREIENIIGYKLVYADPPVQDDDEEEGFNSYDEEDREYYKLFHPANPEKVSELQNDDWAFDEMSHADLPRTRRGPSDREW